MQRKAAALAVRYLVAKGRASMSKCMHEGCGKAPQRSQH